MQETGKMTWYLGRTTTRLIAPEPGAEKERGEFAVERQLRALGIEAHAPRRIEFKRVGKKRHAEPITSAYLPGYIFAEIPASMFTRAIQCRGLSASLMAVPAQEVCRHVQPFIAKVKSENADAERIIESRDRAAMCQFQPGEALDVLAGPFAERLVKFTRMVEAAHDSFPMIEAQIEILGRLTRVKIDPLDVRAAS
jgi:transcriptional antiterminator NusG